VKDYGERMRTVHRIWVRPAAKALLLVILVTWPAVAGCGGGGHSGSSAATGTGTSPTTTSAAAGQSRSTAGSTPAPALKLGTTIYGLLPGYLAPVRNTCYGANVPVTVGWNDVPRGTAELALFLVDVQLVRGHISIAWALAGISPRAGRIVAGRLPPGVVAGRNSLGGVGYSVCPPRSKPTTTTYVLTVRALTRRLPAQPGFNSTAYYEETEKYTKFVGLSGMHYPRY
jgi:phosphatidylethanolamine-binding protein (PEBP) family uncharacterized protein